MEPASGNRKSVLFRNWISLIGMGLALFSLSAILFMLLADLFGVGAKAYMGIFAYIILPAIMLLGILVIPIGMLAERWRRPPAGEVSRFPRIDLNISRHRNAFMIFIGLMVLFLVLTGVGSYRAYQFTESVTFCGLVCHSVMKPEYTAYQASPHARVTCAECHVGPGAGWYVRSKLSGTYQLYAVTFNRFPRPIPSPIKNLRPAQETCEQCHWPEKFWGDRFKVISHFGLDEKNSLGQLKMLIRTGGGSPATGLTTGIHWHMNIMNEVWYIATDPRRQVIPWVRVKDMQGRVTEYQSRDASLTPEEIAKAEKRRMDCIDCHNRPSHIFFSPNEAVDRSLLAQRIDQGIPYIKKKAVEVLARPYATSEEARETIATSLDSFYYTQYPDFYGREREAIRESIGEIQRIYATNFFPEMQVDWRTHPNNAGHFYSPGCFRCHDGQHVSPEGKIIRKDCDICHLIFGREDGAQLIESEKAQGFRHPIDIGDLQEVTCSDCHTGAPGF